MARAGVAVYSICMIMQAALNLKLVLCQPASLRVKEGSGFGCALTARGLTSDKVRGQGLGYRV